MTRPSLAPHRSLRVLGLMSGTSSDGLDLACIEVGQGWRPLWQASERYPRELRDAVLELQQPGARTSLRGLLELDTRLGEWMGACAARWIAKQRPARRPLLIASHGQTVAHVSRAHPAPRGQSRFGATLQLGNPAHISAATQLSVASHFRDGDIAAGGEGAPLVPLFHRLLATELFGSACASGVAIHNIGGISNLSYLGPGGVFFCGDTGPGNIWIDSATTRFTRGAALFDRDGKLAARGEVDLSAAKRVLGDAYFRRRFPKSTGRDDFPFEKFLAALGTRARRPHLDWVSTATWITVESIARAYEDAILARGLPLEIIALSGGGANNSTLLALLRSRLPEVRIERLDVFGMSAQYLEAQAFAYYGYLSLLGAPLGGEWTGARAFGPPARLTPGSNWADCLKLARRSRRN